MLAIRIRDLWARKRRLAGVVIAVTLGVAFLSGALTFGDTLSANFGQLFATATPGTSAVVRSATETGSGVTAVRPPIPASLAAALRSVAGVADAQPSISGSVTLLGSDGKAIGGLGPPRSGGNWLSDPALTPYRLAAGHAPQGLHQVVINEGAARTGQLRIGSVTTVLVPAPVRVQVAGLATFGRAAGFGGATYVAFSYAAAARYLASGTGPGDLAASRGGQVSAIQVSAAPGVSPEVLVSRLDRVLPRGVQALSGAQLTRENLSDLNSAFLSGLKVILVIFAGIALLVAAFSIASTFGIVVAQRTREAALLRALGATRGQLLRGVLAEALAVGVAGSVLGTAAGLGLAELLKGVFDRAGFALPAGGLDVTTGSLAVALVTGIVVTAAVSLVPAVRASRVAPLEALRESATEAGRIPRRRTAAGLVLLAAGLGAVAAGLMLAGGTGTGSRPLAIVGLGALAVTFGVVALGPPAAGPVIRLATRPLAAWRGVAGTLAGRNASGHPRRTASAATALMIGVAVVTLFTVYAASLRAGAVNGVASSFTGDIAITPAGSGAGAGGGGLPLALAGQVAGLPGVAAVSGVATGQAQVGGQSETVTAVPPATIGQVLDLHSTAGSSGALRSTQIAVSSVQAAARHWHIGSAVSLVLPDGVRRTVFVADTYTSRNLVGDYVLPLGLWAPHVAQLTGSAIFIRLVPGASEAAAQRAITRVAAGDGRPAVQGHAAFVASAGQGVSTVLGIVYALLVLAIVIAVSGIANTLSLSVYERTREIGLLRAVGQTRPQLRAMVRLEAVLVSVFGTAGGLLLGGFLGWALAEAGARSSGLTLVSFPGTQLIVIAVLGAVAGVIAAIRPARRAARLPVLLAIAAE
jgi:putative ABC transport system permease protein